MKPSANELVEHFFRHESAHLVSVLTRAFGFARIDLIEDMVQSAILEALHSWKQKGIPSNPAAWIHRVARNRVLDALRREKVHQRALALAGQTEEAAESLVDQWLQEDEIPDSVLRMIFVCCYPLLDRQSQVAMTLKIPCGFHVAEIARGLLMSPDAVKKRIQRAKKSLADQKVRVDLPPPAQLNARLSGVLDVLYLMFNEGYSTTHGVEPTRDDICEEAARLCHLLCEHPEFSKSTTRALMALMLFHAARLDSRTDDDGAVVLLEDQDRSRWNRDLIRIGEYWLARSNGDPPSRFHLEAAIALQHCRSPSVAETNWKIIVRLYDRLLTLHNSPLYVLNRAIARGQTGDIGSAMTELGSIRDQREMKGYYLVDCATARLHELNGDKQKAMIAYQAALAREVAAHEQALLEKKVRKLRES